MLTRQTIIEDLSGLDGQLEELQSISPNLVLAFAGIEHFSNPELARKLANAFPGAAFLGCSTAGEIGTRGVEEGSCIITALRLEKTQIGTASTTLADMEDSFQAGQRVGLQLAAPDLRAVLVFGPGVEINGSALVDGIADAIGGNIPITGGLAGDGGAFKRTFTLGRDGITDRGIVAVGLHGEALRFAHGSYGGWQPFGPARRVTRCVGNILFELDGEPALEVYKRYLGDHARDLPASGLLFPFAMLGEDHNALGLIRTILGVNEADGSLTLAGEIEANGYLKLMHATTDKLVGGAETAAEAAAAMLTEKGEGLALLVSCVGRKLVMGSRVDEEVEAVADVFGSTTTLTGFYSYGEISPFSVDASCKLHNQTMTITYLGEG